MTYFEGKENFWKKQHHHIFGSVATRKQMEGRDSVIRPAEKLSESFLSEYRSKGIESDSEVRNIVDILRRHEVSMKGNAIENEGNVARRMVQPMWYYRKKIKRIYKRKFPE